MGAESKLSEAVFLREYLTTGNPAQAYVTAGYEGDPETGGAQMMRRTSIREAIAVAAERINATTLAEVAAQTLDLLQTRQGLSAWLISVVRGDRVSTIRTQEGDEIPVQAHIKERINAAKLLASIQGLLAPQKHELEVKGDVFVLHTLDNGRAQIVPDGVKVLPADGTD